MTLVIVLAVLGISMWLGHWLASLMAKKVIEQHRKAKLTVPEDKGGRQEVE